MEIVVSNDNKIGRVIFSKIASVGSISLKQLNDVSITGQLNGDVLVYQSNTSSYAIKTLPAIDGGIF
jgi:hypothetical protein